MEIALGIYSYSGLSKPFRTLCEQKGWDSYPFPRLDCYVDAYYLYNVEEAIKMSTGVNVILDGVSLPLSAASCTCEEIDMIMADQDFLDKTQFWLNCKKLDKDWVLSMINKKHWHTILFSQLNPVYVD